MIKLFVIALSLSVTSCCLYKKKDIAIDKGPLSSTRPDTFITHPAYPGQFLACRADASSDAVKSKIKEVTARIDSASQAGKNIILYFHGGLSSQSYMKKTLGPTLIEDLFQQPPYKDKVFPVFFNYDAGPEEIFKPITKGKKLDDYYNIYKSVFESKLPIAEEKSEILDEQLQKAANSQFIASPLLDKYHKTPRSKAAALYILTLREQQQNFVQTSTQEDIDSLQNDIQELIGTGSLPRHYRYLLDGEGAGAKLSAKAKTTPIAELLEGLAFENEPVSVDATTAEGEAIVDGGVSITLKQYEAVLRVLRVIARIAFGTDHGTLATIQEELWQYIRFNNLPDNLPTSLGQFANKHWYLVKEHSIQCTDENSAGRAVIDHMLENNIAFSSLSHSAGSIPVTFLLTYMAGKEKTQRDLYKRAVLLMPAVSQKVFLKYVIKSDDDIADKVRVYSLEKDYERNDKVVSDILFKGSLLYAVSSLAEDQITLDQFLLIEQHLQDKEPYNGIWYPALTCEDPEPVRAFFTQRGSKILKYYPRDIKKIPGCEVNHAVAATHENTKYPAVSCDLAADYIQQLTCIDNCQ